LKSKLADFAAPDKRILSQGHLRFDACRPRDRPLVSAQIVLS